MANDHLIALEMKNIIEYETNNIYEYTVIIENYAAMYYSFIMIRGPFEGIEVKGI